MDQSSRSTPDGSRQQFEDTLPQCNCSQGKVIFICTLNAPCNNQQKYCQQCQFTYHKHKAIRIETVHTKLKNDWLDLLDDFKNLVDQATLKYNEVKELVEILAEANTADKSQTIIVDFQTLEKLHEQLLQVKQSKIMPAIESNKLLELLQYEPQHDEYQGELIKYHYLGILSEKDIQNQYAKTLRLDLSKYIHKLSRNNLIRLNTLKRNIILEIQTQNTGKNEDTQLIIRISSESVNILERKYQLDNDELKLQVEKLNSQVIAMNQKFEYVIKGDVFNPYKIYCTRQNVINVLYISNGQQWLSVAELTQAGVKQGFKVNITIQPSLDFDAIQAQTFDAILVSTYSGVNGVQLGNSIMQWANKGTTIVLINHTLTTNFNCHPQGSFVGPLIIGQQHETAYPGCNINSNHPIFRGVDKITAVSKYRSITTINPVGSVDIAATYIDAVPFVGIRYDLPGLIICITLFCGAGGPWCVDGGLQLIVNALSLYKRK